MVAQVGKASANVRKLQLTILESQARSCSSRATKGKAMTKHGYTPRGKRPREYEAWSAMIQRCYNPKNAAYHNYGARGIGVCLAWRESFTAFFAYMGSKPTPKHSLDRYPNKNGNYEPGNVRWATSTQQNNNRRDNIDLTIDGVTKRVLEWSLLSGVRIRLIYSRIHRGLTSREELLAPEVLRPTVCSVDGCDRKIGSRGLCGKHYQRWRSHGDTSPHRPYSERKRS